MTYKYLHLGGERVLAVRETWQGATRTGRQYLFLHSDRNGSPVAAFGTDHSDAIGTQQWTADRDLWGWTKIGGSLPADEVPFEFPGQTRLDGTEVKRLVPVSGACQSQVLQPAIVSNGFRDYDPVAGIYLARDPIALIGSSWARSSANRNLYAYAGFNPVDRVDYWGLQTPGGDDTADIFVSMIPVLGPGLGMRDAIVQGDWGMAVLNASFLFCDLASFGSMSLVRGAASGAARGILRAEAQYAGRTVVAQALKTAEAEAQTARNTCQTSDAAIPWSNRTVREGQQALDEGATSVKVGNRSQAEELFLGRYQGEGYRNTTGMSPSETKNYFGQKAGTYHWDVGDRAYPHDMNHLQVHTYEGDVVRIYFP